MEEQILQELRLLRAEIRSTRQLATNEEAANYFQISAKSWERLSRQPKIWATRIEVGSRGEGAELRWDLSKVVQHLSPAALRRLTVVRSGDES